MELNSIEEVVEDLKKGKCVVIMDDENRENEGDVICAAEFCNNRERELYGKLCQRSDLYANGTGIHR